VDIVIRDKNSNEELAVFTDVKDIQNGLMDSHVLFIQEKKNIMYPITDNDIIEIIKHDNP